MTEILTNIFLIWLGTTIFIDLFILTCFDWEKIKTKAEANGLILVLLFPVLGIILGGILLGYDWYKKLPDK